MSNRLLHATAACVLGVCVAQGNSVRASANARQHVGPGSVAAGRAHSVIATPDGHVSAWGSGGRGQIGDGFLLDRWWPTPVANLDDVVAVSAGAAHTVALTRHGEVYAWGANQSGRLGDGTRTRRVRPVRVPGLANVTMVAAGRAHTLAVTADGRVFAWGLNIDGQLGVGNKVASLVPVQVRDVSDIIAVAAGDAHSFALTRSGRLFAWGGNAFAMLGDGSTKDRLRPVAIGVSDVVSVAGGAAHSLALLADGSVYSWGRGLSGELGTGVTRVTSKPAMIPGLQATAIAAGRHFSAAVRADGRVVAWGANQSGQLGDRTTARRLRPVLVEAVASVASIALGDAHAIAVTTAGDVHTWGAGDVGQLGTGSTLDRPVPSEVISDILDWGTAPVEQPPDTEPPSITFSTSPPLRSGWMTTPVTVSFQCADNVGIALCPGPVTVTNDGYAQRISGMAIDLAGNQTTASVVVNLDLNPPSLSITEPADRSAIEAAMVEITGQAFDLASGLADGRCNGSPAAIVDGLVRCTVPLHPGRNEIVLHAIDAAGHNSSAAISVTRIGASSSLLLTPAGRSMVITEQATLSLRDEFGVVVDHALWTGSDDEVVTLSESDPPVLTAVGSGSVTITAEKNGVTATAAIEVSEALFAGATRWVLPSLPGLTSESPVFTHRVDASVPQMFTVETERWGEATLRAVTAEGEVLWQQHSPGIPLMGDAFGGVVVGVPDDIGDMRAYLRLGGGSTSPWRYESSGALGRPAQAPVGTIYAIESLRAGVSIDGQTIWDKHALVIDGSNGRVISRALFRREVDEFVSARDGAVIEDVLPPIVCRSLYYDYAPETVGPVVGMDGRGYFLVRRHELRKRGDCIEPFRRRADRTIEMGMDLVIASPAAPPQTINVFSTNCAGTLGTTLPCDLPVRAFQVLPDAIGGTLVTWERGTRMADIDTVFVQRSMTRVNAAGALEERQVAPQFSLEMIGQAGTAIAFDDIDGWKAIDLTSGATQWAGLSPELAPLAASPTGGLATLDLATGELATTGANGVVESRQPLGLDWNAVQQSGDWIGLRGNQVAAVVGDFPDATRFMALRGNAQNQLSFRRPGMGISLKSQRAQEPVPIYHTAIKIAPINQKWLETWYAARPLLPQRRDVFKNLFITVGAGLPNGQDTASNCFIPGLDRLVSDTNRSGDIDKVAYRLTPLPVSEPNESEAIRRLLDWNERYTDDALYACFPEGLTGVYNSNSYVRSLLINARIGHDPGQPLSPSPGWNTLMPVTFFPPR